MKSAQSSGLGKTPNSEPRDKIVTSAGAPAKSLPARPLSPTIGPAFPKREGPMKLYYVPLAVAACGLAAAAFSAPKASRQQQRPAALGAVLRCRAITDEKARLACFDTAVAGFETALVNREL